MQRTDCIDECQCDFFEIFDRVHVMAARKTAVLADLRLLRAGARRRPRRRPGRSRWRSSFAALSDPIRLRLLSYIAAADGDEVCACDLLEPSGRSQPTVSHHMKILFDAGLVTREKRGLWVWYRLVPERLDALRAALG